MRYKSLLKVGFAVLGSIFLLAISWIAGTLILYLGVNPHPSLARSMEFGIVIGIMIFPVLVGIGSIIYLIFDTWVEQL